MNIYRSNYLTISKINKNNNFLNYIEYFKLKFLYKDSLKNISLIITKIIKFYIRSFTSIYNISHGHAVSLTLNKFINFNYKNKDKSDSHFNLDERYKMMFNLSKSKNLNSFDQFISNLKQKANLENDFNKLGINIEKDFSKIISGVNILRLSNNPIKLDKEDLKRIILNT